MPTLDVSQYLKDADQLVLDGIVSEKYPAGKAYTIASPPAKAVLELRRLTQLAGNGMSLSVEDQQVLLALATDAEGKIDIVARLMGPSFAQMLDDGVTSDRMDMITSVVLTYYGRNPMLAQRMIGAVSMVAAAAEAADGVADRQDKPKVPAKTSTRKAAPKKSA